MAEIRRNPQKSAEIPKQRHQAIRRNTFFALDFSVCKNTQAKTLAPTGDKIRVEGSRAQLAPTGRDFLGLPKT